MPDAITDDAVQAAEAQGDEPVTTGGLDLYDLSTVPDDLREAVVPILKDIEGNVGRKLQEAAEFRKGWEPYQELGVNNLEPDEVQALLAFRDLTLDDDAFRAWHAEVGAQLNSAGTEEPTQEVDPLQSELESVKAQLAEVTGRFQRQDEEARLQESAAAVRTQLTELGVEQGSQEEDAVLRLALAFDGEDAIKQAHDYLQQLKGDAEGALLEKKLDEPEPAERPGKPATAATPITSFEEARQVALERLRRSNQ